MLATVRSTTLSLTMGTLSLCAVSVTGCPQQEPPKPAEPAAAPVAAPPPASPTIDPA